MPTEPIALTVPYCRAGVEAPDPKLHALQQALAACDRRMHGHDLASAHNMLAVARRLHDAGNARLAQLAVEDAVGTLTHG